MRTRRPSAEPARRAARKAAREAASEDGLGTAADLPAQLVMDAAPDAPAVATVQIPVTFAVHTNGATPESASAQAVTPPPAGTPAGRGVPGLAPVTVPETGTLGAAPGTTGTPGATVGPRRGVVSRSALAPLGFAARHLRVTVAAAAAALTTLLSWLLGPGLSQYLEAQGMDDERAYLLSTLVLVILATAVVGAAARRPAPTRVGGMVGFVGIQIVPFLLRAASQPVIAGIRYQQDILGWILQPLGMLLLAAVSVIVGAALGVGLARDAGHLPSFFRRRRSWPAIPVAIALVVVASGAAVTALQDGPLGALRSYQVPSASTAGPATPTPGSSATTITPTPDIQMERQIPGKVEYLTIANRQVDVFVPGIYTWDSQVRLPVLYLLHGTPGQPADWLIGGQLAGFLNQMIGAGTMPPLIAVLPNGNTAQSTDTEWGDSRSGDIESWIVNQVVPTIDLQYRTLGAPYRGIAGLSSGGFGAVNIAFQNPTVFRWAGSYSGYFVAPPATFGSAWMANSPLYTAASVPVEARMPVFLGAGTTDYAFKPATLKFDSTLTALGWPAVDFETPPGGHGWVSWQAEMVLSFEWLLQLWGPQPWSAPTGPAQAPASLSAVGGIGSVRAL